MSLLDKASLIVTPNAYKTSKLYSVIPNTALGDMDVVRATTPATRVNSAGLIETVGLNIPRIDYTNGSCPSILVEPQRTNLILRSEEFENASWNKTNVTVTQNATTAPNGTMTADKLIETTAVSTAHRTFQSFSATVGFTYTITIYAKAAERRYFSIRPEGAASYAIFDLQDGVITNVIAGVTATIQSVGNGWYRCSATKVASVISWNTMIYLQDNGSDSTNYTGNGTSGIYIWGAQLELGSYATSYIPTVASTVTRNADVISKTGISSLIGQTEGTVFLEADIQKRNASDFYIAISNGYSLAEAIYLNQPSSGNLNILFRTGVLTPTITVLSANWNIGNNKIAIAYNSTLGEVFINGVSKGTVALTALPTCNQIALGSRADSPGGLVGAGPYKQAILFKTRLTNTELQSLTTL